MMDPTVYTTSVRDKIILMALIIFGVFSFVTLWINREATAVMVGIIGSIIAGLFGIYKGQTATPAITEQTTTQTTETKTEAGEVKNG